MQIKRVLVTHKTSMYQKYVLEKKDPIYTDLLAQKHMTTKRFYNAHENHMQSIETVKAVLAQQGIQYKVQPRSRSFDEKNYDLIVTVGGDGTFLDASQHVARKTIIGINSNPRDSVGRFCAITADGFVNLLQELVENRARTVKIARLKASLNDEVLKPILNDVLICNRNPVVTSRYIIQKGRKKEAQKSSGIWVATAAGSTAAIRGAGGVVLGVEDQRFQYVVREPYYHPESVPTMTSLVLDPDQSLVVYSQMREGSLFLDGSHRRKEFRFGSKLKITGRGPVLKTWNLQ